MNTSAMILGIFIAAVSLAVAKRTPQMQNKQIPPGIRYLFWFLPFLAGGFHTYLTVFTAGILLLSLLRTVFKKRQLKITCNLTTLTLLVIVLGYCVTPVWAADKGMAPFGIIRYLPVLLLALLLMQYPARQKACFRELLPLCAAAMTVAGWILWLVPGGKDFVVLNGRLSGFLQYPNTFAAFALTGLAVMGAKAQKTSCDRWICMVLISGVILSGSRTGVLLLFFLPLAIAALHKKVPLTVLFLLTAAAGLGAYLLTKNGTQITFLGRDIGSFFVRVLYYKDALPVIADHPFGLGYLGYRALETTFQTSRYTVSFVHSGILQLLLDIGWIPALLFVTVILKNLFSPHTEPADKLVLLMLSAHAAVDFDLQFFLFWAILLLCLDLESGKLCYLKISPPVGAAAAAALLLIFTWLGAGDFLYQRGNHDAALKLTPFHTDALASAMRETSDPEELDHLADKILSLNPAHALAYSAKANAAFARGQIPEMMRYKETAIRLTPYTLAEYCDYIEKLYTVLELCIRNADQESAVYCFQKLLAVPQMMDAVAAGTDPLAYRTGNNSSLVLPDPYRYLIDELIKANPTY